MEVQKIGGAKFVFFENPCSICYIVYSIKMNENKNSLWPET